MTKLAKFMKETGLTGSSIARSLGVSTGTVSLVKTGKTENLSDEILSKFDDFIDNYHVKKQLNTKQEIVQTTDLRMAHFTCDETIINQEMGVIYGRQGSGKTWAVKSYASDHPEAALVEVIPMMSTKSLLLKILEKLGTKNPVGTVEQLFYMIVDRFKKSERLLMIDEAENLTTKSLEALRRIHDFSGVPIILSGTYALINNLKGRNGELLQLYSRISNKWEMQGLTQEDRETLFGDFGDQIKGYTDDFRRSMSIFRKATRYSQLQQETLNATHIQMATQSVILD